MGSVEKQVEVKISVEDEENGIWKKMNWKSLGLDGVRRLWF